MKYSILFLVVLFRSTYGLFCYNCVYYKGVDMSAQGPSNAACEYSPNIASKYIHDDTKEYDALGCVTTIIRSSSKAKYVLRGGFYMDKNKLDRCQTYDDSVAGISVTVEQCYCSTNLCNGKSSGSSVDSGSSYGSRGSGGSSYGSSRSGGSYGSRGSDFSDDSGAKDPVLGFLGKIGAGLAIAGVLVVGMIFLYFACCRS